MIDESKYIVWVTVIGESGDEYKITSDMLRQEYQLWHNDKLTWFKDTDPTELYKHCK